MKTDDLERQQWNTWEQHLDHALKNLQEKTAPSDLLPNVMTAIQAREAGKGFRQPFAFRPLWLRVTAAILALSFIATLFFLAGKVYEEDIDPAFRIINSACRTVLGSLADILTAFPFGIGDDILRFLFPVLICLMLTMYLTCIGVGTFIYRTVRR
jgi:hypothetical protein